MDIPSPDELLALDRPEHPYLMATRERFEELRQQIQESERVREWYEQVKQEADEFLDSRLPLYSINDGKRLLHVSRRTRTHVETLALVYWIEGDEKYAERVWDELKAASEFPDWNPRHFLDVAEMTHAFALGYDWLYDYWSDEQKQVLENAMAWYGLNPAVTAYGGTAPDAESWWTDVEHNWNQVVNGGIGLGALALMEAYPKLASNVLHEALSRLPRAMQHYAPDGAWNEGPGYWHYATRFNTYILAALNTTYGTDFGLSAVEGFSEAGWFPMFIVGPTDRSFNFADSHDNLVRGEELFWLARQYEQPAFARYQRRVAEPYALNLLWFYPEFEKLPTLDDRPLDKYFRGTEVATFRSAWNDPEALFAGMVAGDNTANHSNLDLGSFVVDALGVRWATELGPDNYNMPGYFSTDSLRWTYYRMRAEGQNTLVVAPGLEPSQNPRGRAQIETFESYEDRAFAVTDLTEAYGSGVEALRRGIALVDDRRQVLIQDELGLTDPTEVWWFMHTEADVELDDGGKQATLYRDGKQLQARLLSPAAAEFSVMDARPLPTSPDPEMQSNNEQYRKLAIHLEEATNERIAVVLAPLPEGDDSSLVVPEVTSLDEW